MLEENHYYPFGLSMAGISDKAMRNQYTENKYRYNGGSELANKEFSDGAGLEMYETDFRGYDPQIGRFWQIDPIGEIFDDWSSYSYSFNNPILFNDPLGLAPESPHKKKHHRSGPLVETLQSVTITAAKKPKKTTTSPTVNAPPPKEKAAPINYIGYPDSSPKDRKEWRKDQWKYYDRVNSGQPLIQGGESYHYLHSLDMYKGWTHAEADGRIMQYGAVALILGPPIALEIIPANLGELITEETYESFYFAQRAYNLTARDIIYAVRYGMQSRLTIDQIIRLERLAEKYRDLNKFMKSSQQIYKFYQALKDALK